MEINVFFIVLFQFFGSVFELPEQILLEQGECLLELYVFIIYLCQITLKYVKSLFIFKRYLFEVVDELVLNIGQSIPKMIQSPAVLSYHVEVLVCLHVGFFSPRFNLLNKSALIINSHYRSLFVVIHFADYVRICPPQFCKRITQSSHLLNFQLKFLYLVDVIKYFRSIFFL